MDFDINRIKEDAACAVNELLGTANLKPGEIFVMGCSSSEILGKNIGKGSSAEVGEAVIDAVLPIVSGRDLYLSVQSCEHINRALVIERAAALKYGFEIVSVVPALCAGGSCAAAAFSRMEDPVMIEHVVAKAGIDIGDTFIGMHIKHVLVPVRVQIKQIGAAHVTCAMSRPKLIGGERAVYS